MANLQDAPRGRLRVNAPMSFGTMHLAAALTGFANAYPEITVDLELTDAFVDLVDGGIDVAVRITSMQDSTLIARQLAPACRMVAASPDYLAEHGTPQHPRDLSRHNCMIYSLAPNPGTWVFREADGSAMPIPVQGSIRSNNGEVLREAAIAGLGILVDPTFITYRAIRDGRLVPLLCDYELPRSGIHAVYPNRRHLSPKVRAFIDFLGNHFGDPPTGTATSRPCWTADAGLGTGRLDQAGCLTRAGRSGSGCRRGRRQCSWRGRCCPRRPR